MPNVWTCASADRDDVNDYAGDGAFSGSVNPGDTVLIPADDAIWTEQLVITKGIYLRGAGEGLTNITDQIDKTAGSSDSTVPFFATWPGDEYLDISGFTLIGDAQEGPTNNKGYMVLVSETDQDIYPNGNVRIHDITIDDAHQPFLRTEQCVYGVMDRVTYNQGARNIIAEIYHPTCFGDSNGWGDGSWANEIDWGGPGAFYVENCTINHASTISPSAHYALDQFKGSRTVYRYNTFNNATISSHGTETGHRFRGMRHFEIYENEFNYTSTAVDTNMYMRGGTGVIFNNTVIGATTGIGWNTFIKFSNFRSVVDTYPPWGRCDGSSPYDENQEGEDGYRCVDQIGAGTSRMLDIAGGPPDYDPSGGWVENELDPVYVWNNTIPGTPTWGDVAGEVHILENRDFYEDTMRPGYTPFQYPHPLVATRKTKRGRVRRSF